MKRVSDSFVIIGIVLAIAIGVAAAIALMTSANETVLVDVQPPAPVETN